jgi:4'-phosphopantetheinyl transferase
VRLVEVFQADLRADPEPFAALLPAEERSRAAGRRDGAAWTVARGTLRALLGERLGVAPDRVALGAGPFGKPEVPGAALRFNVSHTSRLVVIALAEGFEVGVDAERLDRRSSAVERTLTAGERCALEGVADRHAELLRVWCRKEALAKAIGGGLQWAPQDFDTSARNGYALTDIPLPGGYVGALAAAGSSAAFTLHQLALGSRPAADYGRS